MKTIYKYPLPIADGGTFQMPPNAEIMHTGRDPLGVYCVWALVDTDDMHGCTRILHVYGTGWPLPDDPGTYLTTVIDGPLVWHWYLQ